MRCLAGVLLAFGAAADTAETFAQQDVQARTRLFAAFDLQQDALAPVARAVEQADWPAACRALLAYYDNLDADQRTIQPVTEWDPGPTDPDAALEDTFTYAGQTASLQRLPGGQIDWSHLPDGVTPSWTASLNRQYHLEDWIDAYRETGDTRYVAAWDAHVRDWILQNPPPGERVYTPTWRSLEVTYRVRHWAQGFYALGDLLTPRTRLLLLAAVPQHAAALSRFGSRPGIWAAMETNGLAHIAVAWPELRDAAIWRDIAANRLARDMAAMAYPDGSMKETGAHFQRGLITYYTDTGATLQRAGATLHAGYRDTLERMWNHLAYSLRPDGNGPRNNDSVTHDHRAEVLRAAEAFERPDWRYIASAGESGWAPEGPPSYFAPWAGQLISRNGFEQDAHWSYFEMGAPGLARVQRDALNIAVRAHGRDLLIDPGHFAYATPNWVFSTTHAHNTLTFADAAQRQVHAVNRASLAGQGTLTRDYDLAWGTWAHGYENGPADAVHTRTVAYVRGQYWLVFDEVETALPAGEDAPGRPTVHVTWHLHPDCQVERMGDALLTGDPAQGNIRVVPATGRDWTVVRHHGEEAGTFGWYAVALNERTASHAFVYQTDAAYEETVVLGWLLLPARGDVPPATLAVDGSKGNYTATIETAAWRDTVRITHEPLELAVVRSRL